MFSAALPLINTILVVLASLVIPLAAWAFRLQLQSARQDAILEAQDKRIATLETERIEDRASLRLVGDAQHRIEISLAEFRTEMRLSRKGV